MSSATAEPRVSVLLPVRDAAATLAACLDSLRRQTLADHEIVAVDDGSTDSSRALLLAAAAADRRIRVIATPPRGLPAALNVALAEARAALVARMDADDVAAPERLALQAESLSRDVRLDVLGCNVRLLVEPGLSGNRGMRAYVEWLNGLVDHDAIVRDLWVESPLAHPSVMMRTATLRALGGYRSFDGPEDYDLWLRAHAAGLRFGKRPEVLLAWRDGPRRLTRVDPRYAEARFRALKHDALDAGPLRGAREIVIWGAGRIGKLWARELRARGRDVAAFVEVDARKIGQTIHEAPVVDVLTGARLSGIHLAAVGQPGARERIRALAAGAGLRDGRDLIAVA